MAPRQSTRSGGVPTGGFSFLPEPWCCAMGTTSYPRSTGLRAISGRCSRLFSLEVPHYSGAHSIWAWIATLDGEHRDSVCIENVFFPWVVPTANGRWLVVLSSQLGSSDLRLVDRTAHVRDRVPLSGAPDWSRPDRKSVV